MTAPPDDTTTDTSAIIATLRAERDAALAREAALAEELTAQAAEMATRTAELADRKTEFDERIEHQGATADVLRVMSASPGDAQPVFDLIVRRAVELCNAQSGGLFRYDGERVHIGTIHGLYEHDGKLLHVQSLHGTEPDIAPASLAAYLRQFPMPPKRGSISMRAILDRQILHIRDMQEVVDLLEDVQRLGHRSQVSLPLLRDARAIGVITIAAHEPGGFSESQIALLKTFAEQAVIAITSAETYRALQTRTGDLQESLEYQTATSDVLKVISRSTFDLQPVLAMVAETAARLCVADQAAIYLVQDDMVRLGTNFGFPPEYEARMNEILPLPVAPVGTNAQTVLHRAIIERSVIHIPDVASVPGYPDAPIRLGRQRTSLGVPLLRDGEPVGLVLLARQRVEPFTGRQIELVSTFADQAVIAIENSRLINEQQEALEQQTATAEVLQVINASPGYLAPVFDAVLERALRLCAGSFGTLLTYDGEHLERVAFLGVPPAFIEYNQRNPLTKNAALVAEGLATGKPVQAKDIITDARMATSPGVRDALVKLGGVRALLQVPLVKDGAVVGFIAVWRRDPGVFPDKQIALVEGFAAQAVIAMENARLIIETREALEQQTATADVLQVINASPGDLAPVFDAMLERALTLCDAAFGILFTHDGDLFHIVAHRGISTELAEYLLRPISTSWEHTYGFLDRIAHGELLLHEADLADSEAYRARRRLVRGLVELGGGRTALWVALRKDTALLGTFVIFRREVRLFTDKQIALLQSFASQAVIAMENARLISEQREALEQQTATAEVLQVINASPGNLTPVFDAILDKAHTLCGAVIGSLVLFDGTYFRAVATHGWPSSIAALFREPTGPNRARQSLVDGERFVQVEDIRAIGREPNGAWGDALVESTDARTMLLVPLRMDGALLGFISAFRPEVRAFSDKEITLLENFAAQAVIAMENARLITETREALEQQTATAEVLQVINASPGDLTPVFDAMLEKAIRLCEAEFGTLRTWDGERFHLGAAHGDPRLIEWTRRHGPFTPDGDAPLARIVRGEEVVRITDDQLAAYQTSSGFGAMAAAIGFRSGITLALRKDATLLGTITVYRKNEDRPFTDKQVALLQNFAAQAVIAMENARLITEQREALEQQTATAEVLQVINASPGDLAPVFDAMLEKGMRLCGAAFGMLRGFDGKLSHNLATRGVPAPLAEYMAGNVFAPMGALAQALGEGRPRQILDIKDTEGYQAGAAAQRAIADLGGARSIVVVPLVKDQTSVGHFTFYRQDVRAFTDKQIALLVNFAAQAVIAMENARLINEIRAARDNAEATLRELRTAQANLIQAEKMASLGQLTAGIAHEIKNPLNFVNNFAALSVDLLGELKETAAPGFAALTEKQRAEVEDVSAMLTSNLEKITEHGKRADGIVKAMLEHSRGSSGERRLVDLNALIDEALNLAYHGARAQDQSFNVTLERDFGAGIAPVEVNPQDITRVLLNIISNGFYASNKRVRSGENSAFVPTLKVTTRDAGEAVEIRVRDNGTGIPADIKDKLFQPFFTTKPTGEGTGLGLSITYDIVTKAHGGSIAVDSEIGDHSEFTIRLPRKP